MGERQKYIVLAVDDDEEALEILIDMVESLEDIKLNTANNSFSAGAKLGEEKPDLIILDFLMPELDGFEFCRFIRKEPEYKKIPVLAMTALRTEADFKKMREAGVDDILTKPFNMNQLTEKIQQFRR